MRQFQRISGILPYRSDDFRKGFSYLGYFLKPNCYLVKDWLWMVSKFEKKISHWTNRLLSMGGRLVLIRAVLSSMPVYWMDLVPIPSSILDKLRKVIFSFLWGSSDKTKKFHLVDWHLLARPTSHGGWGIKHLPSFSLSLRMKSFWLAVNSTGIWNLLLTTKYMKNKPFHLWLRDKNFIYNNASIIWKGFIATLEWIGKGIS